MLQVAQLEEPLEQSQSLPQPDPFLAELIRSAVETPEERGERETVEPVRKLRDEIPEKKEPVQVPSPRLPRVQFNMD